MTLLSIRMMSRLAPLALCATTFAAAQQQVAPSAPSPMSSAERMIFVDRQLAGIKPPATLRYTFSRTGSLEPPFDDEVSVELRPSAGGGCCTADGRFLTGERTLALPPLEDAQSNPLVLFFLEYDVREMQRRTGGQHAHFRRRIRLALANNAKISDTTVRHADREWPAKEIRISPYLDDPSRARFERYAGKEYVFVLAPGVPGGVAQLRSRIAGAEPGAAPRIEETVTLAEK